MRNLQTQPKIEINFNVNTHNHSHLCDDKITFIQPNEGRMLICERCHHS